MKVPGQPPTIIYETGPTAFSTLVAVIDVYESTNGPLPSGSEISAKLHDLSL